MATSKFFSHSLKTNTNEQYLVQSMVNESMKNFGMDIQYLPRTQTNMDTILNDAERSSFTNAYTIEATLTSVEGFGGTGDQIGQFGFEVRDTADFTLSQSRFESVITAAQSAITRPREGDIIYLPLTKQLFEITFVEDEEPFFQLSKTYVYQISTALFRYGQQELDTGVADIDAIETAYAQQTILTLTAGGTGTFNAGDTVTQGSIVAEVVSFSGVTLTVINRSGDFVVSNATPITTSGGASWYISIVDTNTMTNDKFSENLEFESQGTSIIDFTETSPFGTF